MREPIFLSTAKARGVLKAPPQKYIFATRELFEGWPLSDMEIVVDRRGKPAPEVKQGESEEEVECKIVQ